MYACGASAILESNGACEATKVARTTVSQTVLHENDAFSGSDNILIMTISSIAIPVSTDCVLGYNAD
eukprot:2335782-Pleurochrysis_carterae.AAC.4